LTDIGYNWVGTIIFLIIFIVIIITLILLLIGTFRLVEKGKPKGTDRWIPVSELDEIDYWKCSYCGELNEIKEINCKHCGASKLKGLIKEKKPASELEEDIGEEHAGLVAEDEEEESEALFW